MQKYTFMENKQTVTYKNIGATEHLLIYTFNYFYNIHTHTHCNMHHTPICVVIIISDNRFLCFVSRKVF